MRFTAELATQDRANEEPEVGTCGWWASREIFENLPVAAREMLGNRGGRARGPCYHGTSSAAGAVITL